MIARVVGIQGSGKNLLMTAMAAYFVFNFPEIYSWDKVYTNFTVIYPGAHYLKNKAMKAFIRKVNATEENGGEIGIKNADGSYKWENIIILVDEIDGLYPQWGHGDKDAQRDLSGAYQDEKLHNQIFCTTHKPDNFNKIMRDAAEVIAVPEFDESEDILYMEFIDDRFRNIGEIIVEPASVLFDCYDREEVVI